MREEEEKRWQGEREGVGVETREERERGWLAEVNARGVEPN